MTRGLLDADGTSGRSTFCWTADTVAAVLPYVVKSGEYLEKIAHARGFDPDACWNDPKNKDLKDLRKDPNILCAGDVLYVPEPKKKAGLPVSIGSSNPYVATIPMVDVSLQFKEPGGGLS